MLLWKRYVNNKMAAMRFLHLQQYSHRLNLLYVFCHQINAYLQELAQNYPQLVTLETIGQSYQGRDMIVIKISSGGGGTRPVVLVDAGIHAREWVAPGMALYIINQLVENNAANSALTDAVDWYILPVLNPDGYEYSHTTVSKIYSHPLNTNDS